MPPSCSVRDESNAQLLHQVLFALEERENIWQVSFHPSVSPQNHNTPKEADLDKTDKVHPAQTKFKAIKPL